MQNPNTLSEYKRERRRIQQLIRRASKRGYIFGEDILPQRPEVVKYEDVQRLKRLTPERLYKKATFKSASGSEIQGTEARKIERSLAAQKAAETRLERVRSGFYQFKEQMGEGAVSRTDVVLANAENAIVMVDPTVNTDLSSTGEVEPVEEYNYQTTSEATDTQKYDTSKYTQQKAQKFGDKTETEAKQNIVEDIQNKIDNWSEKSFWSEGLAEAKSKDRATLMNIFTRAKMELGREGLAKRLEQSAIDINELIESILYDSGKQEGNFKDGRTQVNANITRFAEIVKGHALNVDESIALTADQEEYEYEE